MSIKLKLISFVTAFVMMLSIMVVGVYALQQTINLEGIINFQIDDKSLWVSDVRIKNDNYTEEQSIENFMPGYINNNFNLSISTITNNYGSFTLYFDIINTTEKEYNISASYDGSEANVTVSPSITEIPAGTGETITSSTQPTATLAIEVSCPQGSLVDLSDISIIFGEIISYTATINVTYSGGLNTEDIYIAINDDEDFTCYMNENYTEDQEIVLNNVTRIAFGGIGSKLTRVVTDPIDMTVTSNTGIKESIYYDGISSVDTDFLGWYELTQDTVFNVLIERHNTLPPEPGVVA